MKRKKYDEGSNSLLNTAGPRMTNTPGENFGYSLNINSAKKAAVRQKPTMNAEMQKVARLQQKMKDAGYNIKVDGAWKGETQRIYDAYTKGKAADASRRGTVNTGQGPVATQPKATSQAKSNTYNPLDSPVLRQASADTQVRMKQEQAAADAKVRARQAEIARNSQSLPSDTRANRFTFNAADKGQGQDMTIAQDNALKQNKLVGDGATSKNSTRIQFADGTKKLSRYSKLDAKLGGYLPGGVSRAEAKEIKAAKNATSTAGPLAGGYGVAPKPTEGVGPLAGGYSKPAPDLSKPVGPMTDIRRYTNADNMPAGTSATPATPAKKSLKSQYEENKGGYARALKSGKKDAQGNLVDPNTGLAYKKLPSKRKTSEKEVEGLKGVIKYTQDVQKQKESDSLEGMKQTARDSSSWFDKNYTFGKEPGIGKAIGYIMSGGAESPNGYSFNPKESLIGGAKMYVLGRLLGAAGGGGKGPKGGPAPRGGASNTPKATTSTPTPAASSSSVKPSVNSLKPGPMPPTKGDNGKFQVNPSKQGKGTSTKPGAPFKSTGPKVSEVYKKPGTASSSSIAKPNAVVQGSVQGPAEANLRQSASNKVRTAGRKTKETGKKLIKYAQDNKKKTAIGAGAIGTVGAGIYAASKMRTSEG